MTDATSEPTSDWAHFFHVSHPPHQFMPTSIPADPSHVITAPAAAAATAAAAAGKATPRKRSRASRRAPTTLLNTDTANFRAMVQQFTGVPNGPYITDGFGLGFGSGNPTQVAAMPQQQRQYYEYRPPLQQQQGDVTHMGYGMMVNGADDGRVMPGFFYDGLGHGYTLNG